MTVNIYHSYSDLPEEAKAIEPKSWLNDYRCYLVIKWDDGKFQVESSLGDPEDNTFRGDYKWIAPALLKAWELGYRAGRCS